MSTHENWQFSFVKEKGADVLNIASLGSKVPLIVEQSSLNNESVLDLNQPTTVVNGTHSRVRYGFPTNPSGYTLTGAIKIFRKNKEFPRSAVDSTAVLVLSTTLTGTRDVYKDFVDHAVVGEQNIWYYTVFYELNRDGDDDTVWAYSSVHGHDRAFVLNNGESQFGNRLFNYMPVGIRLLDESDGDDNLSKLFQIIGKAYEEFKESLNHFERTMYDYDNVDAHLIPYIDQLIGWPTNFELSEKRRRKETSNAVGIWKKKGTAINVEFASQVLTGWNTEVVEGQDYILTTYGGEPVLDPNTPPGGWVESTDGVWADIVNSSPFNGTVDLSNPADVRIDGRSSDNYRVIAESETQGWRNPFGVLVELISQISDEDPLISNLAKDKLRRLIQYLVIHYANTHIQVEDFNLESFVLSFSDVHDDDLRSPDPNQLSIVETASTTWDAPSLHTYPHPDPNITLAQNGTWTSGLTQFGRTYHSAIG